MSQNDPKGYYAALGVTPDADASQIKAAFRKRAMELHPDRNSAPDATKKFQFLNEAYAVLSDENIRAEYDTSGISEVDAKHSSQEQDAPEPIVCSCCGKITAQPRYAIFYETKSFIVFTRKSVIQGIYCSACANKKALKASLVTWLLGWWGFPWGFIYTLQSLAKNLSGGTKPSHLNAKIANHQAWYFAMTGKIDIAKAVAFDALKLAESAKGKKEDLFETKSQIYKLIDLIGADGGDLRLKDMWAIKGREFYMQAVPLFSLTALALTFVTVSIFPNLTDTFKRNEESSSTSEPYQFSSPAYTAEALPVDTQPQAMPEQVKIPAEKTYERPKTDPKGNPWPPIAGYLKKYPIRNNDGLSKVTIDNTQNDSDVFLKLTFADINPPKDVRYVYIPAGQSFLFENVTAGNYYVKYKNLNTGKSAKSENFLLEEIPMYDRTQFSNMTMTLYKVRNGNMHTEEISEEDF